MKMVPHTHGILSEILATLVLSWVLSTTTKRQNNTQRATKTAKVANKRNNAPRNSNMSRSNTPRKTQGSMMSYSTSVPLEKAYTLMQTSRGSIHRESASEKIGDFQYSQNTPIGSTVSFRLAPTHLPGTRIQQLGTIFQKFRFRRARLVFRAAAPTSVGGTAVLAYNTDPTKSYEPPNGAQNLFASPQAISTSFFTLATVEAKLDTQTWFLSKIDEGEEDTTIQGAFHISMEVTPNVSAPSSVPIYLEYEVEFKDSTEATTNVSAGIWPSTTFTVRRLPAAGVFDVTVAAGETAPFPAMTIGRLYQFNPAIELATVDGDLATSVPDNGEPVLVPYVAKYSTATPPQFFFYATPKDFEDGNPLLTLAVATDSASLKNANLSRTTVQLN